MRKYLLLLLTLLATGTALADSYFYIDHYEFTVSDLGTWVAIPVKAHFDGRLDSWTANITLPEGLTPIRKKAYAGSDMSITYEDEYGESAVLNRTLTLQESNGTLTVSSVPATETPGYSYVDFGDESYGNVKWEAEEYYEMFILQLRIEEYFMGGEIVIETSVDSTPDARGETVVDNGDASNPYTFTEEISFYNPPVSMEPIISFEEQSGGVLVVVEGEGDLLGEIQIDGATESIYGYGRFEYFIPQTDNAQIIYVYAYAIQSGCLESGSVECYYELAPMPVAPDACIEVCIDDDDAILTITGDGVLTVCINNEVVASGESPLYYRIPRAEEDHEVVVTVRSDVPGYTSSEVSRIVLVPARYVPMPTEIPCYTTYMTEDAVVLTVTVSSQVYLELIIDGVSVAADYGTLTHTFARTHEDMVYLAVAIADAGSGFLPAEVEFEISVPALEQAYDFEENGIYYIITSYGKVSVCYESASYNTYSGDVVIPATVTHDGRTYKVTGIKDRAFKDCAGLTSVTIGSNVTTIGNAAFENCTGLTNVVLDDYVITVGSNAFYGCSSLASVTIGSGVRNIGAQAFKGCPALTSVICKPAVPPVMGSSDCFDCYSIATLTVHPAVIDDYRSNANWSQFATIVESEAVNPPLGDADGDGQITIRDVSALIDMLLGV